MALLRPDPSFYPSPRAAMAAPPEQLAYVAMIDPRQQAPDALAVVDVDETSPSFGQVVGRTEMPGPGDELHHFGWNACSAALCPYAPHPHVERRYLVLPGLRSSRLHVLDVKEDPTSPKLVKTVEASRLTGITGYSRPHTSHCGPDALYMSALGDADGSGPGGVFTLDHETFEPKGRWEIDRGPQYLAYDFWWHLGYDTMVTSEWGTPEMVEGGLVPELLLERRYGRHLHLWDLRRRRHLEALPLGEDDQMVLELRPAHDPTRPYGFVGVVTNVSNLAASVWVWHLDGGRWKVNRVIEIPPEPAEEDALPPALKPFGAVPPLVTDIVLSLDDRYLYVSCWGTGELRQYDVSDPFKPRHTSSVRIGGITARAPHPSSAQPRNGGPQMVELSRDGRRLYVTNSLYLSWDEQFYPEGIRGWMARVDVDPQAGRMSLNPDFLVEFDGYRPHQVRLSGGDSSSDSYCYP